MLGDLIYEHKGKITNQRVLDSEGPKIEATVSANGSFRKSVEVTETVTYWSILRPGGALYGEAQGLVMSKGNDEVATYTAQGVGRFADPGGKIGYRGSVFYRTASTGKLAFLNNLVGVFEYEADKSGNTTAKTWEWK